MRLREGAVVTSQCLSVILRFGGGGELELGPAPRNGKESAGCRWAQQPLSPLPSSISKIMSFGFHNHVCIRGIFVSEKQTESRVLIDCGWCL